MYKSKTKKEQRQTEGKRATHTIPKYIDFSTFDQAVTGGGTLYALSVIPQGAGQSQRMANTVKFKRLVLNFFSLSRKYRYCNDLEIDRI